MTCHFLRLPAELRREIYTYLFTGLKVSLSRTPNQNASHADAPWHILSTCRRIWCDDLHIFYDLATIVLHHELRLHLLKKKLNPENLSLVRNVEIRNLNLQFGGPKPSQLPPCLKKLVLWENEVVGYQTRRRLHRLKDKTIRDTIHFDSRVTMNEDLWEMWGRNQKLAIFIYVDLGRTPAKFATKFQGFFRVRVQLVRVDKPVGWNVAAVERVGQEVKFREDLAML